MKSLFEILRHNAEMLKPYLEQNRIEAYRLYYLNDRRWPMAIDIYGDNAVIHYFATFDVSQQQDVEEAIKKITSVKEIFIKDRSQSAGKAQETSEYHPNSKEIVVTESGHKFLINLSDYLDMGLFLDHRETRRWIEEQSNGKIVLNTFAYTASFSVYASAGGATKTYSVDLSKTYCEWMKRNFELNNLSLEQNWVYKMDTFEFFNYAKRKGLQFDIIIIDPPTFSRNKGISFSLQKDHPRLLNAALELLTPSGFILFSNNYQDFKLNKEEIHSKNITEKRDTVPPDFRTSKMCPNIHRSFVIRH